MKCPACQAEKPATATSCERCGSGLGKFAAVHKDRLSRLGL